MNFNLENLRKEIDNIDLKLLSFLKKRFEIIEKIKKSKEDQNLSFKDLKREKEHLNFLIKDINKKSLKEYLESNFLDIFKNSFDQQRKPKIGLIGKDLKFSPSYKLHNIISNLLKFNYEFENIEMKEMDNEFIKKSLKQGTFSGFFLTMPYKKEVLKICDFYTRNVLNTGVCNLVYLKDNKIYADNTDTVGFFNDFIKEDISKNYVPFILGDGATASSVSFALEKMGFKPSIFVTKIPNSKSSISYDMVKFLKPVLVVNTTPVGMGDDENVLLSKEDLKNCEYFYDCVNNPLLTSHLKLVKRGKNGLGMLIYQGLIGIKEVFKLEFDLEKIFIKIYKVIRDDKFRNKIL